MNDANAIARALTLNSQGKGDRFTEKLEIQHNKNIKASNNAMNFDDDIDQSWGQAPTTSFKEASNDAMNEALSSPDNMQNIMMSLRERYTKENLPNTAEEIFLMLAGESFEDALFSE